MSSKRRFARTAVSFAFAAAAVFGLGGFSPVPPNTPAIAPAPQPRAAEPPPKPKVKALTAVEIRDRGLDNYIDMSRQKETAPTLIDGAQAKSAASPPDPTQENSKSSNKSLASGCWSLETYDSAARAGIAYHTWCGDGVSITHTSTSCAGNSAPNYVYEGCTSGSNYGVGWNAWDVIEGWNFCTSYDSSTGACATRTDPWQENRYGADGQVWLLRWGS
ncbi:hypothetical protein SAMN05216276_102543 [Streptosporangium subroseum]|uniref:Secreted protein n=1 Tax=Streptosporangium subroseum TaxID=106412 RepID=A0A239K1F9_9ACTN|nr:hypothetical protein [Streptosporangium subroseum]SNT11860.1 hypothetical protein SAMN05216276_102543 [Streptosporangium subroseum]